MHFYSHRTITAHVYDAKTEAPFPGADVEVSHAYVAVINAPERTSARTDSNGVATIRAATFDSQRWKVFAQGYELFVQQLHGNQKPKTTIKLPLTPAAGPSVETSDRPTR